jgi:hypothetical protein
VCRDCAAGSRSHAHQRLESGEPPKLNVQIGVEAIELMARRWKDGTDTVRIERDELITLLGATGDERNS